jgi:hypothetical protein
VPTLRGVSRGSGIIKGNRETWLHSNKTKTRMSIMDEMAIVIKIMRLLRTGKIDRHTTNIEVLKMVINNKE